MKSAQAPTMDVGSEPGTERAEAEKSSGTGMKLLDEIERELLSATRLPNLDGQTGQMVERALKAETSSLLLLDDRGTQLVVETGETEADRTLKQMGLDSGSGIARWVALHGKPLIVNNVRDDPRFNKDSDQPGGPITRSAICVPLVIHGKTVGALEVLNKLDGGKFATNDLHILVSIASTAAATLENRRLRQSIEDGYKSTIRSLAAAIDAKDPYTRGHSQRVMEYALLGGRALSLSQSDLEIVEHGAVLHDIGKIGIPDGILLKPGPLTPEEREIVCRHPVIGAAIIENIPFLSETRRLVLHHHERYDGSGYPAGLRGEEIPLTVRLLTVADTFDTMTTRRPYCSALSDSSALNELRACSGTQFCPLVVAAFVSAFRRNGNGHGTHSSHKAVTLSAKLRN